MKRAALWLGLCLCLAGCASSHKRHEAEAHAKRHADDARDDDGWGSFVLQMVCDLVSLVIQESLFPGRSDDRETAAVSPPTLEETGGLVTDWWR